MHTYQMTAEGLSIVVCRPSLRIAQPVVNFLRFADSAYMNA